MQAVGRLSAYMLSFRNAKTVDLYVNRRVSENRAFIRKSEDLGKSGFYVQMFLDGRHIKTSMHSFVKKNVFHLHVSNSNLHT